MPTYFIAGIDTAVGKTAVTGLIGRWFLHRAANADTAVCTMKIVETGVADGEMSHDIVTHRRIMGIKALDGDRAGTTCPYRFRLPASPHLSAALESREIELQKIVDAANELQKTFDILLIEGVGGLLAPLSQDVPAIDVVQTIKSPVILVTSGRLGSINHTLLSLEALTARHIPLAGLVYNQFCDTSDDIRRDTFDFFRRHLRKIGHPDAIVEVPAFTLDHPPNIDFSSLIR